MSNDKDRRGFTLIELLVVGSLFIIVSTLLFQAIVVSLRGSTKSDSINFLRQNGNFALTQMERTIRFAKSLDAPASCSPTVTVSSITVTSFTDAAQTIYSCPVNPNGAISSNSALLTNPNSVIVPACSFTCSQLNADSQPVITIKFTLSPKNASSLGGVSAPINFETSLNMRNIGQ